ncbi:hypothetical protein A1Q2_06990 [Trichosporon asahii var. asahii CBS 8904]|uniref:Protein kinase domain-containing protein n=1 Tax=Trichosporon asahii var. asahii (strain CBS 8904) TaxID=1220162 RepID=K1WAT8_TRIAC|nr:hypothetical protein A1Q2_06990 [Trichosporon asahii var. asahii CBS 8904]
MPVSGSNELLEPELMNAFQVVSCDFGICRCPLDLQPPLNEPLYRVRRTGSTDNPSFSLHAADSKVHTLRLYDPIESGALYTAFRADFGGHSVVAKFAVLKSMPLNDAERPRGWDGHDVQTALKALRAEEAVFAQFQEHLAPEARKYVPRNYGLFRFSELPPSDGLLSDVEAEREAVYCRIEGYMGRELTEAEQNQPGIMDQLGKMYKAIHAAGVLHEDIAWRHITMRGGGTPPWPPAEFIDPAFDLQNLAIIDWNMSRVRQKQSDAFWQELADEELYDVAILLRDELDNAELSMFEKAAIRRYESICRARDSDHMPSNADVGAVDNSLVSNNSDGVAVGASTSGLDAAQKGGELLLLGRQCVAHRRTVDGSTSGIVIM